MMELEEVVAIAVGGIDLLVTTWPRSCWRVEDDRSSSEPRGEIREKRRESTVLAIIVPTVHRTSVESRSAISVRTSPRPALERILAIAVEPASCLDGYSESFESHTAKDRISTGMPTHTNRPNTRPASP